MLIRQVTLDRSNRKADSAVSITFVTDLEQGSEEFLEIDELRKQSGALCFKPNGRLTDEELGAIDKVDLEMGGKTLSQRLRNTLYVAHEQSDSKKDFKEFYADYMESQIQKIKDKLV